MRRKKWNRATLVNAVHERYSRMRGRRIVHVLHIGKTGGTAIKHALRRHRTGPDHGLVLHEHRTTLMDVPRGDQVVLFLRDPISRFVSGFYSGMRQGRPRYVVPWDEREAAAFSRFTTPNQLAVALSSEDPERRAHAEAAMRSIRHVEYGFGTWLGSEGYFRSRLPDIFFIGFQETLAADFDRLVSRLGLSARVRLPTDEVAAHRTPPDLDRTLDPVATENLRRWYADDFRLYHLGRELAESVAAGRPGDSD